MKKFIFALALMALLIAPAAAQDRRISNMTDGGAPLSDDMIPAVRSGANIRIALGDNLAALAGLIDPGADRLLFWDDSAGTLKYLTLSSDFAITDTTLAVSGYMATATYDAAGIAQQVVGTSAAQTITNKTINGNSNTLTVLAASQLSGIVPAANGGAGSTSGILKANGSGTVSAASSGTDYAPATSGSSILYGNGSGGFSNVTVGTGLSFSTGTLAATNNGDVVGPSSATDNALTRFDGTTGKLVQNSGALLDDSNNLLSAGYMRIGSTSAPNNTTAGDLTAGRLSIGNGSLSTNATAAALISGSMTDTSGTTAFTSIIASLAPASNSSALFRTLNMSSQYNASSVNFTASFGNSAAGYFESRAVNAGTITGAAGVASTGLVLGSNASTLGTVSDVAGYFARPVNSFSNSVSATVTRATGMRVADSGAGSLTITGQAGIMVDALSAGSNNSLVVLGQSTIPTGNYAIYSASTNASSFGGTITATGFTGPLTGDSVGLVQTYSTANSSNLVVQNTTGAATTSQTEYQLLSSSSMQYRVGMRGSTPSTVGANRSYAGLIIGTQGVTEASSGTHPLFAQAAIRAPSYTNAAGATDYAATLYIEGTQSGITPASGDYALWVDAGEARFDGSIGDTTNRVTKLWATDAEFTNAPTIGGTSATGSGGLVRATSPTLVTPTLGAASATSLSFSSTSGIIGTTTNDSAASGSVGQYVSSTVAAGSAVSMSTGVDMDVTSISLTAGDWDIWGTSIMASGGSATRFITWISSSSATFPTPPNNGAYTDIPFSGTIGTLSFPVNAMRVSISSPTTYYLSAEASFTGSRSAYGSLMARRVR